MSRRRAAVRRKINPDPKFGSELISKFINVIMSRGKKSIAERIVYSALDKVAKARGADPQEEFGRVIELLSPELEVRPRRVGGATYPVPTEVRPVRRRVLAMRWLKDAARARSERTMDLRLAGEILDVLEDKGGAVRKRDEMRKVAESNRAFAHYRF